MSAVNEKMMSVLSDAKSVEPIALAGDREVYTFADAVKIAEAQLMAEKVMGKTVDLGERQMNPDGATYASGQYKNVAVDPSTFFVNRYRKAGVGKKVTYEVVTDYRAIKEQATGTVYTNNVVVHVIGNGEDGLTIEGRKTVSPEEFVKDFRGTLGIESMRKILMLINGQGVAEMTADELEF